MELPLVVGVDGSASSLQALDWAVDEAARNGLPLRIVHASRWEWNGVFWPGAGMGFLPEEAEHDPVLAEATVRATDRNPGVEVSVKAPTQEPVTALLDEASNACAVVVGSRGHGEIVSLLLGTVSLSVAGRALCPVIVVRGPEGNRAGTLGRITLGVGIRAEGVRGTDVARFAFREAGARGCPLHAVHIWQRTTREHLDRPMIGDASSLAHEGQVAALLEKALHDEAAARPEVVVRRETVEGQVREVLLKASGTSDLLVVGAQRRKGPFGLQLGRVNHTLLHHADCPVAVVPEFD